MAELTEAKLIKDELETYSFHINLVDIKKLDVISTTKGILNMFAEQSRYFI